MITLSLFGLSGCSARQNFASAICLSINQVRWKLAQDDVTRICKRIVDHGMDTGLVAQQFEISRRRVQQLAKAYRENGKTPQLETLGRRPYADYPDDLEDWVLNLCQRRGASAVAIAHVLRVRDDLSIANNRVHEILQDHDHATENPTKQGHRRPWVRFERGPEPGSSLPRLFFDYQAPEIRSLITALTVRVPSGPGDFRFQDLSTPLTV